jgi:C4-dicarboxylate-specific signal transduction histidine kinase
VLINLLVNAAESMRDCAPDRRRLGIRVSREVASSEATAEIAVEDCGVGLGKGGAKRLFEPFYSTKANGLGMGLSISRSIVESHGGRLWATPNATYGATFHVALPAAP